MSSKQLLEKISDLKITLYLFIILGVLSLIGVIIPQHLEEAKYFNTLGTIAGTLIVKLGINNIFNVWWFNLCLFLLLINLIACISTKIWRSLRLVYAKSYLEGPDHFTRFRNFRKLDTGRSCEETVAIVRETLRKKFYSYSIQEIYKGISLSAKKGTFNKIGSIALHLGAIILFAGGLLSSKLGFVYYKNISPGEVIPVRERAFKLRVDDFKVVTNERGEIKDYLSDLSVIENGSVVLQKRIEVNDPLDYRGIYFYQSSYGQEIDRIQNSQLRIQSDSLGLDTVLTVPFGEPVLLGRSNYQLITKDFFGDFSIDVKTKQVTNRSFSHNNPAMKVVITNNKGSEVHSQWLFLTHTHFHSADKGLVRVSAGGYTPVYYTGLQIRKNPGVGLIWAGIITISLGLLLVFYVPVKQIWVLIERRESGCLVYAAGKCDRFQAGFKKDFNGLVSRLIPESEKR